MYIYVYTCVGVIVLIPMIAINVLVTKTIVFAFKIVYLLYILIYRLSKLKTIVCFWKVILYIWVYVFLIWTTIFPYIYMLYIHMFVCLCVWLYMNTLHHKTMVFVFKGIYIYSMFNILSFQDKINVFIQNLT